MTPEEKPTAREILPSGKERGSRLDPVRQKRIEDLEMTLTEERLRFEREENAVVEKIIGELSYPYATYMELGHAINICFTIRRGYYTFNDACALERIQKRLITIASGKYGEEILPEKLRGLVRVNK